ncbi:MAG: Gfo/Idh/MocA family oxidoreductase [Micromonosporaceae bacterium]|nr:Gfo/Idh/MocA family oxidoreductase [Micromonosporaceae bacterium]
MTGPLRFGVLGCADIAVRRTLPAICSHPDTTLTWVASRDPAKAARVADRFGCRATDYAGLLERDDVDAVYLPLPPSLHLEWGAQVLACGKHLLVEKPLAPDAAQAAELAQLAAESGLVLRDNMTFLHHPVHARVRELVAAGRLGEVRALHAAFCFPPLSNVDIRYSRALAGGALLDAGVYPLRCAQLMLGEQLRVAGAVLREDPDRGVDLSGQALLVSAGGVPASLAFGFEHSYGSWYTLWGSTARLHLDRAFTPPAYRQPVLRIEEQDRVEELTLAPYHQFEGSVGAFAAAARDGGRDESVWRAAALGTLRLADQIRDLAVRVPAQPRRGQPIQPAGSRAATGISAGHDGG